MLGLFPRLIVVLNMSDVSRDMMISNIIVFEWPYVFCALIFALIIGIVVMILEWNVLNTPGKTFFMALSVPALLSGGFNTNSAIDLYKDQQSLFYQAEQIQRENPIPTVEPVSPAKIKQLSKADNENSKEKYLSFFVPSIRNAYATDSYEKNNKFLAFKVKKELYIIVLATALNKQDAIDKSERLRNDIREAEAVDIGGKYYVILGGIQLPWDEALIRADRLRRQHSNLNLIIKLLPLN
jgi:hypothetical protein